MAPSLDIVSITEFCGKYKVSKGTLKAFNLENPVSVQVICKEMFEQKSIELLSTVENQEPMTKRIKLEILTSDDKIQYRQRDEVTLVTDQSSSNILESSVTSFTSTKHVNVLYTSDATMILKSSSPPL